MYGIAEIFYEMFWKECGTKGLTVQQKIDALCKLRDLSLRLPYWSLKENEVVEKGQTLSELFPELIPSKLCNEHNHSTQLSGLLLYTIHMEIFKEIKPMAEIGELTQEQIKQLGEF